MTHLLEPPALALFKCGRVLGVGVEQPHMRPQAMQAGTIPYGPPP
jgi:hypothetical protein